jgi:hypothetical protein
MRVGNQRSKEMLSSDAGPEDGTVLFQPNKKKHTKLLLVCLLLSI